MAKQTELPNLNTIPSIGEASPSEDTGLIKYAVSDVAARWLILNQYEEVTNETYEYMLLYVYDTVRRKDIVVTASQQAIMAQLQRYIADGGLLPARMKFGQIGKTWTIIK